MKKDPLALQVGTETRPNPGWAGHRDELTTLSHKKNLMLWKRQQSEESTTTVCDALPESTMCGTRKYSYSIPPLQKIFRLISPTPWKFQLSFIHVVYFKNVSF